MDEKIVIMINVPKEIDLEHMQLAMSNAIFYDENVTVAEQHLILDIISKLIKNKKL